jgi:Transposase DDE domain
MGPPCADQTPAANRSKGPCNTVCWVVERSFAWLSRYRRLNTIFERSKEHLIAFVAIAFISILARRLKRLVRRGRERLTSTNRL